MVILQPGNNFAIHLPPLSLTQLTNVEKSTASDRFWLTKKLCTVFKAYPWQTAITKTHQKMLKDWFGNNQIKSEKNHLLGGCP